MFYNIRMHMHIHVRIHIRMHVYSISMIKPIVFIIIVSINIGGTPSDSMLLSNGWALCPAWFSKVIQAAQHVIYVAVRAPARP